MYKFIYAFDQAAADVLKAEGYKLLQQNEEKKMFVFEYKDNAEQKFSGSEYVFTNTLAFPLEVG